jgi:hypothetical protein
MSVADEIKSAIEAGKLSYLELSLSSDPTVRTMLAHPEIREVLNGPWTNDKEARRAGRLRADLERFVTGEVITMSLRPRDHEDAYMGLLEPVSRGVFDIRSRDPKPGIRIFGGFPMPNVFAAMNYEYRSVTPDWSDRRPLAADEMRWQLAILECEARWNKLFSQPPIKGAKVSDFITADATAV